jgi:hypothetical protein
MRSLWKTFSRSSLVNPAGESDSAPKSIELVRRSRESTGDEKILTIDDEGVEELLAHSFTPYKKWMILTVIFLVQISMNFNASVYANSVPGMVEEFGVSKRRAFYGQMAFLVTYVSIVLRFSIDRC